MKKMIFFIPLILLLCTGTARPQTDQAPPANSAIPPQYNPFLGGNPQQFSPFQIPTSPWSPRGPGMGNYGFQGFGPGMGFTPPGNYGAPPAFGGGNLPFNPGMTGDTGYYNYGPGVMMGQGMMQFGMGPGMIRGIGGMGYISTEAFQKFFDETRDMRKELNGLMFDYAELLRQSKQDPAQRVKLENRILALRQKVYDKAPRYQYPFQ